MSLSDWADNRWIVPHAVAPSEIDDLFGIVDRDLADAAVADLSPDWQLGIAYNAALQLATLALMVEGFRPGRDRGHERAVQSLRLTIGASPATVDLLDAVRRTRNLGNYEVAGRSSTTQAAELRNIVVALRLDVVDWLHREHPALLPPRFAIQGDS